MSEIKYYRFPESNPLSYQTAGFGIKQTGGSDEACCIEFEVYEIINQAPESLMKGSVKWDGCINYTYTRSSNYYLHACSPEQAQAETLLIMSMVYQLAINGMPTKHDNLEHTPLEECALHDDGYGD
jgi:hypothetical protein